MSASPSDRPPPRAATADTPPNSPRLLEKADGSGSGGSGGTQRMLWPSRGVANFARFQPQPGNKLIRTPQSYHATYDTRPPPDQVVEQTPTHAVMKVLYQRTDRQTAAAGSKRDPSDDTAGNCDRPLKTPRSS